MYLLFYQIVETLTWYERQLVDTIKLLLLKMMK